jgi:hypothetical protein
MFPMEPANSRATLANDYFTRVKNIPPSFEAVAFWSQALGELAEMLAILEPSLRRELRAIDYETYGYYSLWKLFALVFNIYLDVQYIGSFELARFLRMKREEGKNTNFVPEIQWNSEMRVMLQELMDVIVSEGKLKERSEKLFSAVRKSDGPGRRESIIWKHRDIIKMLMWSSLVAEDEVLDTKMNFHRILKV